MRSTFRFRWLPFLACTLAALLGIALGNWQTRRAVEKEGIASLLAKRAALPPVNLNSGVPDPDTAEFRRATVQGAFRQDWALYLDNRPQAGKAGFYVLMPLRMRNSDQHVLVARGWVQRDVRDRTALPPLATPEGEVSVEGVIRKEIGQVLQLGNPALPQPNAILQNLNLQEFSEASKIAAAPLLLEQTSELPDGLVRDWPKPSSGADKHRGYAFQWYALAATALIFFVVSGFSGTRETQKK